MSDLKQKIVEIAGEVVDPHTGQTLAAADAIGNVGLDQGDQGAAVLVEVQLGYPAAGFAEELAAAIERRLKALDGVSKATADVTWKVVPHQVQGDLTPLPEVRNIIAVASGKGGVGKSTTSANLALALVAEGARVGILDADVYGPSQPRMLGLSGQPESPDGKSLKPMENHGVQAMSIGFLIEEDTPMVWRGPMVTQALTQLLNETRWDNLDYLIIDLPPGTGDTQLTLSQKVPVSGALIVTTPQDIALLDAKKALRMFEKVEVPVLGLVENMSVHVCTECGHVEPIFGAGGGARMAEQYNVELLGQLPLNLQIREDADGGRPTVARDPESEISLIYREIARHVAGRLSTRSRNLKGAFPKIVIK